MSDKSGNKTILESLQKTVKPVVLLTKKRKKKAKKHLKLEFKKQIPVVVSNLPESSETSKISNIVKTNEYSHLGINSEFSITPLVEKKVSAKSKPKSKSELKAARKDSKCFSLFKKLKSTKIIENPNLAFEIIIELANELSIAQDYLSEEFDLADLSSELFKIVDKMCFSPDFVIHSLQSILHVLDITRNVLTSLTNENVLSLIKMMTNIEYIDIAEYAIKVYYN